MIKIVESEKVKVEAVNDEIEVTIGETSHLLTIDEFKEMRQIADIFWDHNGLWNKTSEAIKERDKGSCMSLNVGPNLR